jgi:hypothetical protein
MTSVDQIKNANRYVKDITLEGGDLFSKYGFSDGDMLRGHVEMEGPLYTFSEMLVDRDDYITYDRLTTVALVEVYLLPRFDRPLTLFFTNYLHNSCRVEEAPWWGRTDGEFYDTLPSVEVPSEEVYAMLYAIKTAIEWALAGKPLTFPECLKQTARIFSDELNVPVAVASTTDALEFPSLKALPAPEVK